MCWIWWTLSGTTTLQNRESLQQGLEKDWANFGTKPTASFTLRTLNSAGALYARALRHRGAAFTSEDSDAALRKMKPPGRGGVAP